MIFIEYRIISFAAFLDTFFFYMTAGSKVTMVGSSKYVISQILKFYIEIKIWYGFQACFLSLHLKIDIIRLLEIQISN